MMLLSLLAGLVQNDLDNNDDDDESHQSPIENFFLDVEMAILVS